MQQPLKNAENRTVIGKRELAKLAHSYCMRVLILGSRCNDFRIGSKSRKLGEVISKNQRYVSRLIFMLPRQHVWLQSSSLFQMNFQLCPFKITSDPRNFHWLRYHGNGFPSRLSALQYIVKQLENLFY